MSIKRREKRAKSEDSRRQFRIYMLLFLGTIGLMVLIGGVVFLITIEGAEQTMVPDLAGKPLEDAILALQEKELNTRIQLQYSSKPGDKGAVLSQDPTPGASVRAGSHVTLRVSKGAVIDRVENYIGWEIDDLRLHLQTLFTTHGPLLRIKEPIVKVFDEADAGTILEQKPEPGTELTDLTDLELVISRGPAGELAQVAQYTGLSYTDALERLVTFQVPFVFELGESDEGPGLVVAQDPEPGTDRGIGEGVSLVMTPPAEIPEDHVFGILDRTLPDYPIIVDITLNAINTEGVQSQLISFKHSGGKIGIPFIVEENTMLVLSVFDKEILRYTVTPAVTEE